MSYTFTQTGAQIQTILDQVGDNTNDIATLNATLTQSSTNLVNDCNSAIEPHKLYSAEGNTANRPNDTGYWTIMPIRYSATYLLQLAFLVNSTSPVIYARNKQGSTWGAWYPVGSSSFPAPGVSYGKVTTSRPSVAATGGIAILHFAIQIPAGTYAASDNLWSVVPAPRYEEHFIMRVGSNTVPFRLATDGNVHFNSATTLDATVYAIGQCVYRY